MNPLATASMATAIDVAREAAPEAPMILWPADWPAPELVAWTLAHMLAETLPASRYGAAAPVPLAAE